MVINRCISLKEVRGDLLPQIKQLDKNGDGKICNDERPGLDEDTFTKWMSFIRGKGETPAPEGTSEKTFSIGFGLIAAGIILNPFSGLSSGERHVPVHPDDIPKGAFTEPIELKDDYAVFYPMANFYFTLGVRLTDSLRLKNRFSTFLCSGMLTNRWGYQGENINAFEEGNYNVPPLNRQIYASGENAYTFVSIGKAFNNFLGLEMYLGGSKYFPVQFGLNFILIEHIYGWDRYAKVEFESSEYKFYPGLRAGISLSAPWYEGETVSWTSRQIDVSFAIGFTDGVPVMLFEIVIPPYLAHEIFF